MIQFFLFALTFLTYIAINNKQKTKTESKDDQLAPPLLPNLGSGKKLRRLSKYSFVLTTKAHLHNIYKKHPDNVYNISIPNRLAQLEI